MLAYVRVKNSECQISFLTLDFRFFNYCIMPRKTKGQKMAAALHRMKKKVEQQESSKKQTAKQPAPATEIPKAAYDPGVFKLKEPAKTPAIRSSTEKYNYAYVTSDLRKALILSAAAIALEIVLNLTLRSSFAELLLRRFGIGV